VHKMVTVRDIWTTVLPPGTELLAGEAGLGRDVSWITSLRPRPPAFDALKGGEFALVSLSALRALDERVTLAELIGQLNSMGVVAIAVANGAPDRTAIYRAQVLGLPLFSLPEEVILNELERRVARLLAERRLDTYARSQDLSRQLMEMAIEGKGVATIVRTLARVSGRAVVVEDEEFLIRSIEAPEEFQFSQEELLPLLETNRGLIAQWLEGQRPSPSDPPTKSFAFPDSELARVVSPVATRDGVLAYLSLIGPVEEISELEHVAASRGAAALAVELARERAVLDAQDRMQESFVDALLSGSYPGEEVILSRAKRLGYDLSVQHAVLVFRLLVLRTASESSVERDGRVGRLEKEIEQAIQREVRSREGEVLLRIKGNSAVLLCPVGADANERRLKDLADTLRVRLSASLGNQVSVGIGRLHKGVEGLKTAHREAEQAVSLGIRLFGRGTTTYFGDLGLYRLLLSIQGNSEVRTFYHETLGKLLEYDRKNNSELVKTLDVFFTSRGSPTEAAERLHLHRNTLLYRLHRIREISGLDLDDPEIRLSLHLALRIGQSLSASRGASIQKASNNAT